MPSNQTKPSMTLNKEENLYEIYVQIQDMKVSIINC